MIRYTFTNNDIEYYLEFFVDNTFYIGSVIPNALTLHTYPICTGRFGDNYIDWENIKNYSYSYKNELTDEVKAICDRYLKLMVFS